MNVYGGLNIYIIIYILFLFVNGKWCNNIVWNIVFNYYGNLWMLGKGVQFIKYIYRGRNNVMKQNRLFIKKKNNVLLIYKNLR